MLRRIDWSTPAIVLDKIIRYEAVHEISDWEDLRRRIDPPDRRCYAFFHPALVDDPLIFVEVALTRDIPDAIAPILSPDREVMEPEKMRTAVFYSISNCQRGLAGVSFGNFLIKQVVEEICREMPKLSTFVTLSPVTNFTAWLARERAQENSAALSEADKALFAALTVALAEEVAKDGILVNAVAPSIMDTAANRKAMPMADFDAWPKVEEVAATILFLASPDNRVTRGAIVPVYGKS